MKTIYKVIFSPDDESDSDSLVIDGCITEETEQRDGSLWVSFHIPARVVKEMKEWCAE